ncbi:hypothetical protein [Bartonella tribocorum]|uniref:Uncharacterized protein n=1 Tax=Bartonella tribocorum TaxID=85701 RepID=A0A2M6UTM0_9HYPH|nr:hypothetical protein [Bartonella tribocorum]PIT69526.1 hypothetical protein CEV08_05860 [Bartonella tribocorum]
MSSISSHDYSNLCLPSGYWDEMKTVGQTGATIVASVGAVGGAILGTLVGTAATAATGGVAAPTILGTAESGYSTRYIGWYNKWRSNRAGFGAVHHLYNCVR